MHNYEDTRIEEWKEQHRELFENNRDALFDLIAITSLEQLERNREMLGQMMEGMTMDNDELNKDLITTELDTEEDN